VSGHFSKKRRVFATVIVPVLSVAVRGVEGEVLAHVRNLPMGDDRS
jgi:hypothetical protein